MKRSVKQRVLALVTLIPLILISTVIFRFSAQSGEQSTKVSNGVTVRLLSLFMDVSELSDEELETLLTSLRHKIRKTAHILEYAAFGFFLELHQHFVGERIMQVKDVGFDLFGAALGIGAYTLLALLVRRLWAAVQAEKQAP